MWVFVTTAARYADAVPWEFLRSAVTRGTAVAVVLDRVPPEATEEVRPHLGAMLTEQGLGGAPLFVVPETTAYDAMLPDESVDPIRSWLHGLASDATLRSAVVRHTLDGAVRSLGARVFDLAAAADEQAEVMARLRDGGRRGVRRRRRAGRRRQQRRVPAARRGAGPLAGVRRHRRADALARVEGRAGARPGDGRRAGQADARRGPGRGAGVGSRGARAGRRRRRGRAGRRPPGAPTPPGVPCSATTTCGAGRRAWRRRRRARCATGRRSCSTSSAARRRASGGRPATWRSG